MKRTLYRIVNKTLSVKEVEKMIATVRRAADRGNVRACIFLLKYWSQPNEEDNQVEVSKKQKNKNSEKDDESLEEFTHTADRMFIINNIKRNGPRTIEQIVELFPYRPLAYITYLLRSPRFVFRDNKYSVSDDCAETEGTN